MGYEVLYGPEIAPDGTHPERESYREPLLTGRLRDALVRLNPDISVLSDEFLTGVRDLPQKNVAVELLRKLINDQIRATLRKNVVQSRKLSEMLEKSVHEYENRSAAVRNWGFLRLRSPFTMRLPRTGAPGR